MREIIHQEPKIAICFFGITRSLTYTIGSIEQNILAPAREVGEVRIFAHFFRQATIDNPRTGEKGALRQDEHTLLNPDWLELEEPGPCLAEHEFEGLKAYGDAWNDDFRSLRNLVHQLHSIVRVTDGALVWGADTFVFVRPDLLYHDCLGSHIVRAMERSECQVILPNWQHAEGGYNDRFAICRGASAGRVYGRRVRRLKDFCVETGRPVHSERLLKYALHDAGIKPALMSARASRVRANNVMKQESFAGPIESALRRWIREAVTAVGLRPLFTRKRREYGCQ